MPNALYRHEALIYAGEDDFVAKTTRFLRDGAQAHEPALVVVSARKIALLRESLDGDADGVVFADMADVGLNPARIIPAWRDFVATKSRPGVRLRGIGEPIFVERTADELVECQRHEALLNLAFQDAHDFWLLCPYDSGTMPPDVIAEAERTHPYVMNGDSRVSTSFYGLEAIAEPFAPPLPAPPGGALEAGFDGDSLGALRAFVRERARAADLAEMQQEDLVLAVNELASNSVRHGGGKGTVRIWREGTPWSATSRISDASSTRWPGGSGRSPDRNPATASGSRTSSAISCRSGRSATARRSGFASPVARAV